MLLSHSRRNFLVGGLKKKLHKLCQQPLHYSKILFHVFSSLSITHSCFRELIEMSKDETLKDEIRSTLEGKLSWFDIF